MFAGFITRLDPEANILGEGESNEQVVALSGLEPGTIHLFYYPCLLLVKNMLLMN